MACALARAGAADKGGSVRGAGVSARGLHGLTSALGLCWKCLENARGGKEESAPHSGRASATPLHGGVLRPPAPPRGRGQRR